MSEASPIRKAVVDTGPLFSALTIQYLHNTPVAKHASILYRNKLSNHLVSSKRRQAAFAQLFGEITTVLTTSHVIGEIQGLQGLKDQDRRGFWLCAITWLREKNTDEALIRLLDMSKEVSSREAIYRIGPTDAGLIDLARREGTVLLTDDRRTLAPMAWRQGIDCRLVEMLIP
jgi:rRNA-processing protein FCF1